MLEHVSDFVNNYPKYLLLISAMPIAIWQLVEKAKFIEFVRIKKLLSYISKKNRVRSSLKQVQEECAFQKLFKKRLSKNNLALVCDLYERGVYSQVEIQECIPYLEFNNHKLIMRKPKADAEVWLVCAMTFFVSLYLVPTGALLMAKFTPQNILEGVVGLGIIVVWAIYGRFTLAPFRRYRNAKKHKVKFDEIMIATEKHSEPINQE